MTIRIRPNPYGEGFVLTRLCTRIQQDLLLYRGRYCAQWQLSFPTTLRVFATLVEARNEPIAPTDVWA